MSRTSGFSFTNRTAAAQYIQAINLGLVTNYAVLTDKADEAALDNLTASLDAGEHITYRSRPIEKVNTSLFVANPAPVKSGVQYQIVTEAILSTTDSADPTFRVDEPIVVQTTIRHPRSGNFTNAIVAAMMSRHLGSMLKGAASADTQTWRFEDLMRSSERPTVD